MIRNRATALVAALMATALAVTACGKSSDTGSGSNTGTPETTAAATSTAAMPTSEWKAATSSGIAVIGTRRAITAPMPPPMAMPRMTRSQAEKLAGTW